MAQCEANKPASVMAGGVRAWITQKRCSNTAKYRVTRKTLWLGGGFSLTTQNLCGRCAMGYREYRYKLDNHLFYNDDTLDHEYPIIETLPKEGLTV